MGTQRTSIKVGSLAEAELLHAIYLQSSEKERETIRSRGRSQARRDKLHLQHIWESDEDDTELYSALDRIYG